MRVCVCVSVHVCKCARVCVRVLWVGRFCVAKWLKQLTADQSLQVQFPTVSMEKMNFLHLLPGSSKQEKGGGLV